MNTPEGDVDLDFNPYAAPKTALRNDDPTDFHRIVSTRLSYREYWRISTNPIQFLLMAVYKTLRIRVPFRLALLYPRSIDRVERDQIPAHVLKLWEAPLRECEALGLHLRFGYVTPSIGITKELMTALLASEDGLLTVGLTYWRFELEMIIKEKVVISAASLFDEDRRAITRNDRSYLDQPPGVIIRATRKRTVGEVVAQHRLWLNRQGWKPRPAPQVDLDQRILEKEQQVVEFLVGRKVLVPMTVNEVERFNRRVLPGVDLARMNTRLLTTLRVVGWYLWIVGAAAFGFMLFGSPTLVDHGLTVLVPVVASAGLLGSGLLFVIRVVLIRLARRST